MLYKTIVPNTQDLKGETPVEILKISSKGLDKTASMQKRAAAFEKEIKELKPLEKKAYLHVITTCASEVFGPNRNNDAYNEGPYDFHPPLAKEASMMVHVGDGLKKCHKTYLEGAHVYQEHRTDEAPSGIVKAAMYNEPMHRGELLIEVDADKWAARLHKRASGQDIFLSIGCSVNHDTCFAKDTLILTQYGYREIQDIKEGDYVFSNKGNWKQVTATMNRQAAIFTTIRCAGLSIPFQATSNHPIATIRQKYIRGCSGSNIIGGKKVKRRHTFYKSRKCSTCNRTLQLPIQYVPIGTLCEGDYIAVKLDSSATYNTVGKAFAYLCGMYLGDGSPLYSHASRVQPQRMLAGISISASADQKDKDILQKIEQAFFIYTGKQIKVNKQSDGKNAYKVDLLDTKLAQRILAYVGKGSKGKYISKSVLNWSQEQKLSFLGGCIDSDGCVGKQRDGIRYSTVNKALALGIQRLCWSIGIPATVNIGAFSQKLKGAGCFSTSGNFYTVVLMNRGQLLSRYSAKTARQACFKRFKIGQANILLDGSCAYLRVKTVTTVHREPIRVYNLEVEDDHTYNADGLDVHNCTACGHRAHTLDEHCEHIKKHAGLLLEDGTRVAMINDNPKFYDISGVNVPADTMAYVLRKVASGESAQNAIAYKYLMNATRPPISFNKMASMLSKLSKIQKEILCKVQDDPLFTDNKDVEDKFLHAVENFDSDEVLDQCNRKAILLSPRVLFKLMGKDSKEKDFFDMYADNCPCDCEHLMQDMENDPGFRDHLLDGSFDTVMPTDLNLANILEAFVPDMGVSRPALNGKAIRIEIHMGAPKGDEEKESFVKKLKESGEEANKEAASDKEDKKEEGEKEDLEKTANLIGEEFRRTYARYVLGFAARNNQDTCNLAMQKLARYRTVTP